MRRQTKLKQISSGREGDIALFNAITYRKFSRSSSSEAFDQSDQWLHCSSQMRRRTLDLYTRQINFFISAHLSSRLSGEDVLQVLISQRSDADQGLEVSYSRLWSKDRFVNNLTAPTTSLARIFASGISILSFLSQQSETWWLTFQSPRCGFRCDKSQEEHGIRRQNVPRRDQVNLTYYLQRLISAKHRNRFRTHGQFVFQNRQIFSRDAEVLFKQGMIETRPGARPGHCFPYYAVGLNIVRKKFDSEVGRLWMFSCRGLRYVTLTILAIWKMDCGEPAVVLPGCDHVCRFLLWRWVESMARIDIIRSWRDHANGLFRNVVTFWNCYDLRNLGQNWSPQVLETTCHEQISLSVPNHVT